MKKVLAISAALISLIIAPVSYGQQHTVNVLATYDSTASVLDIPGQMAQIAVIMNSTPGLVGEINISYANMGFPVGLSSDVTGSSNENMRTNAISKVTNVRDLVAADLVVVFVGGLYSGKCGYAGLPNDHNWSGANSNILLGPLVDLRQVDDYFIALVSTASNCDDWDNLTAHEVGHLFGAGHESQLGLNESGLFFNSHADYDEPTASESGTWTVMASRAPPALCDIRPCSEVEKFSDNFTFTGGSYINENFQAILATKFSVSVFREPPLCTMTPPSDYLGGFDPCWGGNTVTRHVMSWEDACPSEPDRYDFWAQQPASIIPIGYDDKFATVFAPQQAVVFYVWGAAANVKGQSCKGFECTGLSSDTYFAEHHDECH